MFALATAALLLINALTMLRFWQDKGYALAGASRIPESELLGLAFIGGSPGALIARQLFRHKTRKQPFSTLLMLICFGQTLALLALTALRILQVFV